MNINELAIRLQLKSYQNNHNEYYVFLTEFEKLLLSKTSPKNYTQTLGPIVRFIKPAFLPKEKRIEGDFKLVRAHFLPSHKERELVQDLKNKSRTPLFETYAPECCKNQSWGIDKEQFIANLDVSNNFNVTSNNFYEKDRADKGTSFFKVENTTEEHVVKTIEELKKEIHSLKRHRVVIGEINDKTFGVFEEAMGPRTEDPVSIHCNFWKLRTNNPYDFDELGKFFKIVT